MTDIDALAERQLNDPHYLQSVTQLGDTCPIVASREIHASSGMKLINAGMRVNSSLYDRLLQHKLVPSLDESLTIENTVTGASLEEYASRTLQEEKRLALIQSTQLDGKTLPQILKQVPLNPAIAFKLTVMREANTELFRHSIFVALVSTYIGMQLQLNKYQLTDLATAALLHDIGILHIDPKLLKRDHQMTEVERRHLYVHSVTGGMVLSAYPEYKNKVLDAVLQHHERLDGSGYPRGLKSGEIGQLGQVVAVAEIVASRYSNDDVENNWSRLETILKLNLRRYGGDLVPYLKVFYQDDRDVPPCSESEQQAAQDNMSRISAIFSAWERAQDGFDTKDPVSAFINERMTNLKLEIVDAGLYLNAEDGNLLGIKEDPRACFDARILLEETLWQLRGIIRAIRRRWPSIDEDGSVRSSNGLKEWIREVEALL